MINVTQIYVYPLKSAKGIPLCSAQIGERGIEHDREFVVVDEQGMFVAQRSSGGRGIAVRRMCQVLPMLGRTDLTLRAPGCAALRLGLTESKGKLMSVQLWDDFVVASDQGDEAAYWITQFLAKERPGKYRIMRLPRRRHRQARQGKAHLAFADAYPLLMLSRNSLADLNYRMVERGMPLVSVDRFRPNIFLDGCDPYTEDRMARFTIGNVHFEGQTLCVRCATVNTDQTSAEYFKDGPLTVLNGYRRNPAGSGVVFGRNVNHLDLGRINVGDNVKVTKWDDPWTNGV